VSSTSPGSELRRLRALVGDLDAVVWEADASSGRFTFVSEGAAEILGYPAKVFLHQPSFWADHIHPEDREAAVKEFMSGVEEGRPHDMEYRFVKPRGDVVWVRDIGHAVTDMSGTPITIRGLMVDITQQKLAEEHRAEVEQRYRLLVEQLPGIVYTEDADPANVGPGRFTYVSQAIEPILGYTVKEWLADPAGWVDRLHPDDVPTMREAFDAVVPTGAAYAADYRMFAKDGHIVWIHDEAVLVRDEEGAPLYWQGVMLDVSAQREAEDALRAEREEAAELRALDEMKNTFLQAVSHDLRTPLAAILGIAVTLEREEGLAGGETRELASRIGANARKLDRMVTDLLDLDRISRGIVEPKLKRTDLAALVRRVVAEFDATAEREVEISARRTIAAVDPAKVERIVENLLSNAVRHTPPGSHIWIRVEAEGAGALLAVEDDGPGVPPEHRTDIFQPFRQGAGAPDHSPGVGIGLALVARFAELHGGRAWVQDREGGGASFRVWLPLAGPAPAQG
jgi:PAS domain S-box-containing protein